MLPSIELSKEILILLKLVQNTIKLSNENFVHLQTSSYNKATMSSLVESNIHLSSEHKHPLTINQMSSQYKMSSFSENPYSKYSPRELLTKCYKTEN